MEMGRIPEAIAGYDYVLRIHPLDAGSFINRRELLKSCTFKGQCNLYSFEEGQMIPQIGYIYTFTIAMDEVNEQNLEEYDPDLVEKYDGLDSDDDDEVEVIKKEDPRYRTRTLVYFTPEGLIAHGQLEHSPEFPAYAENYVIDGYEVLCPENIWCGGFAGVASVLLCQSIDFVLLMTRIRLKCLMCLKEGWQFAEQGYEDGWDEWDREDCQRVWGWVEGRV